MKLVTRAEWGARHGVGAPVPRKPVTRAVIHHAQSPDIPEGTAAEKVARSVRAIERHHAVVNGWNGIGYNFMVDQDGRIYEGRGWGRAGAHAGNATVNQDSVGICFLIDGRRRAATEAAWQAAREILLRGIDLGELAAEHRVTGHRDHRATVCPGDAVYDDLDRLRDLRGAEPMVGRRVWSTIHGYIVVTRYHSDDDWTFVPLSTLEGLEATPAGTALSRMPTSPP